MAWSWSIFDQPVERAADTLRATVENVSVDHGRADVFVPKEALDGADVIAVLEEMGGERVPERVATGRLRDPGGADGVVDRTLDDTLVQMVAAALAGRAIDVRAGGPLCQ